MKQHLCSSNSDPLRHAHVIVVRSYIVDIRVVDIDPRGLYAAPVLLRTRGTNAKPNSAE